MQYRRMIAAGGASFIVGAVAFVLVFSYLATNFDYPDILDGSAAEVLPRLAAASLGALAMCLGETALAAFRNVTSLVQPLADVNNFLLPVWMIILGIALIRCSRHPQPDRAFAA